MNCRQLQQQLMLDDNPLEPDARVRVHLRACAGCRKWYARLQRLETAMHQVPVLKSERRDDFIREFLEEQPKAARTAPNAAWVARVPPVSVWTWWNRQDPRRRAIAAGCLAASLLFVTFVVLLRGTHDQAMMVRPQTKRHADPFLARIYERDVQLAAARTPQARLQLLTELANDLQTQTQAAARDAHVADLQELTRLYVQVLQEGLLVGAAKLPAEQRRIVLSPIAERLAMIGAEVEKLAGAVSAPIAEPLLQIVAVSRQTDDLLRALVTEPRL
jgi:hypothetical protein